MQKNLSRFLFASSIAFFSSGVCAPKIPTPQPDRNCHEPYLLQLGHRDPGGVGYSRGYTSLKGFYTPDWGKDAQALFDGRIHVTNNGRFASNLGIGGRVILNPNWIFGANSYYDFRSSDSGPFHQIGWGLETLGKEVDFRLNGYLPVGNTRRFGATTSHIEGNRVIDTQKVTMALPSLYGEIGRTLFTPIDLYLAAGPYYLFSHRDGTDKHQGKWGGKVRLSFEIANGIFLEGNYSYDGIFHSRAQGAISFRFPWHSNHRRHCSNRAPNITQPLDRNEIIPIRIKYPQGEARDLGGDPIRLLFIDSNNVAGRSNAKNLAAPLGHLENPLSELPDLSDPTHAGKIIYILPGDGSPYKGITLGKNQKLAGSGSPLRVGDRVLPALTSARPKISGGTGSAITLPGGSSTHEITGLDIKESAIGITINAPSSKGSLIIRDNTFDRSDVALHLDFKGGEDNRVTFLDNNITGAAKESIFVAGTKGGELSIQGNTFSNMKSDGEATILFKRDVSNVNLANNTFTDITGSQKSALYFGGKSQGIKITGNTFSNVASSKATIYVHAGKEGTVSKTATHSKKDGEISGNIINAPKGSNSDAIIENHANFFVIAGHNILSEEGDNIIGILNTGNGGLIYENRLSSLTAPNGNAIGMQNSGNHVVISDNTIVSVTGEENAFGIHNTGNNVLIANNVIGGAVGEALNGTGIYASGYNLSIIKNSILGCFSRGKGDARGIHFVKEPTSTESAIGLPHRPIVISDNDISILGADEDGGTLYGVHIESPDGVFSVSGNTITNLNQGAIAVYGISAEKTVPKSTSLNDLVFNITALDNTVSNATAQKQVVGLFTTQADSVTMRGNTISDLRASRVDGIVSDAPLGGVDIERNTISSLDAEERVFGINVLGPRDRSTYSNRGDNLDEESGYAVSIADNTLSNLSILSKNLETGNTGIYAFNIGSGIIRNNTIIGLGRGDESIGIHLNGIEDTKRIRIERNHISELDGQGRHTYGIHMPANDRGLFHIVGNTIEEFGAEGIVAGILVGDPFERRVDSSTKLPDRNYPLDIERDRLIIEDNLINDFLVIREREKGNTSLAVSGRYGIFVDQFNPFRGASKDGLGIYFPSTKITNNTIVNSHGEGSFVVGVLLQGSSGEIARNTISDLSGDSAFGIGVRRSFYAKSVAENSTGDEGRFSITGNSIDQLKGHLFFEGIQVQADFSEDLNALSHQPRNRIKAEIAAFQEKSRELSVPRGSGFTIQGNRITNFSIESDILSSGINVYSYKIPLKIAGNFIAHGEGDSIRGINVFSDDPNIVGNIVYDLSGFDEETPAKFITGIDVTNIAPTLESRDSFEPCDISYNGVFNLNAASVKGINGTSFQDLSICKNVVANLTGGLVDGISGSAPGELFVSKNIVANLAGGVTKGIVSDSQGDVSISKNTLFNLSATIPSSDGLPSLKGISAEGVNTLSISENSLLNLSASFIMGISADSDRKGIVTNNLLSHFHVTSGVQFGMAAMGMQVLCSDAEEVIISNNRISHLLAGEQGSAIGIQSILNFPIYESGDNRTNNDLFFSVSNNSIDHLEGANGYGILATSFAELGLQERKNFSLFKEMGSMQENLASLLGDADRASFSKVGGQVEINDNRITNLCTTNLEEEGRLLMFGIIEIAPVDRVTISRNLISNITGNLILGLGYVSPNTLISRNTVSNFEGITTTGISNNPIGFIPTTKEDTLNTRAPIKSSEIEDIGTTISNNNVFGLQGEVVQGIVYNRTVLDSLGLAEDVAISNNRVFDLQGIDGNLSSQVNGILGYQIKELSIFRNRVFNLSGHDINGVSVEAIISKSFASLAAPQTAVYKNKVTDLQGSGAVRAISHFTEDPRQEKSSVDGKALSTQEDPLLSIDKNIIKELSGDEVAAIYVQDNPELAQISKNYIKKLSGTRVHGIQFVPYKLKEDSISKVDPANITVSHNRIWSLRGDGVWGIESYASETLAICGNRIGDLSANSLIKGVYGVSKEDLSIYDNMIFNLSTPGEVWGIEGVSSEGKSCASNNRIFGLSGGGDSFGLVVSSIENRSFSDNRVWNLSGGKDTQGISAPCGGGASFANNRVWNVSAGGVAYGIEAESASESLLSAIDNRVFNLNGKDAVGMLLQAEGDLSVLGNRVSNLHVENRGVGMFFVFERAFTASGNKVFNLSAGDLLAGIRALNRFPQLDKQGNIASNKKYNVFEEIKERGDYKIESTNSVLVEREFSDNKVFGLRGGRVIGIDIRSDGLISNNRVSHLKGENSLLEGMRVSLSRDSKISDNRVWHLKGGETISGIALSLLVNPIFRDNRVSLIFDTTKRTNGIDVINSEVGNMVIDSNKCQGLFGTAIVGMDIISNGGIFGIGGNNIGGGFSMQVPETPLDPTCLILTGNAAPYGFVLHNNENNAPSLFSVERGVEDNNQGPFSIFNVELVDQGTCGGKR